MYINESLCCMPEMNTTALQIDYNFENGVEPRSSFLQSTPLPNTWTPPRGPGYALQNDYMGSRQQDVSCNVLEFLSDTKGIMAINRATINSSNKWFYSSVQY